MALKSNLGFKAEKIAQKYLEKLGYRIIDKNFRSKFGEIDIIALDGDSLIFTEVKYRKENKFGKPEEFVSKSKLAKIIKTSQYFIYKKHNLPRKMRIEVVSIEGNRLGEYSIKLIKVD